MGPEETALSRTAATCGAASIVSSDNAGLILSNRRGKDTPNRGGEASLQHIELIRIWRLNVPSFIKVFSINALTLTVNAHQAGSLACTVIQPVTR